MKNVAPRVVRTNSVQYHFTPHSLHPREMFSHLPVHGLTCQSGWPLYQAEGASCECSPRLRHNAELCTPGSHWNGKGDSYLVVLLSMLL